MTNASDITRRRALRAWLFVLAAMVFAMVVVGGATRVTGSGLSIVEWKPVTGTVPPLSQADWQTEFDKYKTIPQYREQNRGMSLDDFKSIYWWEWSHRLLGRAIGFVFLIPFVWFLWRGWVEPTLRRGLWVIFGLGALQGGVGWWMVASGLSERVSVAHERLAFHLTLACVIYVAIVWTAQRLRMRDAVEAPGRLRWSAGALLILVLGQIFLGALVAGQHGGMIYNTWPDIDGGLIPSAQRLWFLEPAWRNLVDNILMVQFLHRMMAYVLWLAAVAHLIDVIRTIRAGAALNGALAVAVAVTFQAAIGILTLLYQAPIALALAHQAMAVIVLTVATIHAERLLPRRERAVRAQPLASGSVP